jgi:Flp pilus assembly protein TadD
VNAAHGAGSADYKWFPASPASDFPASSFVWRAAVFCGAPSSTDHSFNEEPDMNALSIRNFLALSAFSLALGHAAIAADTQTTPAQNAQSDDFSLGKQAIDAKNWSEAASRFSKVVAKDPKNADAFNYLGYSSRWMGKYDEAFAAYGKALALDPNHKGALSYSGIAYLKTGQRAQAEAQLAKLQTICSGCSETSELAKAMAAQ